MVGNASPVLWSTCASVIFWLGVSWRLECWPPSLRQTNLTTDTTCIFWPLLFSLLSLCFQHFLFLFKGISLVDFSGVGAFLLSISLNNWTQLLLRESKFQFFRTKKVIKFSFLPRYIEDQPIPETPAGEPIQLQSFPFRKGSSSIPDSVRDRRPDGAEEPEVFVTNFFGERKGSKSSVRKSLDTLSSCSKLQQIPERQPLMSALDYPAAESPPPYNSRPRHRSQEFKVTSHTECRPFNRSSPNCDQHRFSPNAIHTLSEKKLWELIKWSPKRKWFDLWSNSLNSFFKEIYRDQFGEFVCGYWG